MSSRRKTPIHTFDSRERQWKPEPKKTRIKPWKKEEEEWAAAGTIQEYAMEPFWPRNEDSGEDMREQRYRIPVNTMP